MAKSKFTVVCNSKREVFTGWFMIDSEDHKNLSLKVANKWVKVAHNRSARFGSWGISWGYDTIFNDFHFNLDKSPSMKQDRAAEIPIHCCVLWLDLIGKSMRNLNCVAFHTVFYICHGVSSFILKTDSRNEIVYSCSSVRLMNAFILFIMIIHLNGCAVFKTSESTLFLLKHDLSAEIYHIQFIWFKLNGFYVSFPF